MSTTKLPNYLRTHRKRAGFSQDELAHLLGCLSGAKVCRYERFAREPSLKTAFALEAIFDTPARQLFGGLYQKVEKDILAHAKVLACKLTKSKPNRLTARKVEVLRRITQPAAKVSPNEA